MTSGRLTLPIDLLFILDGFGNLRIHSCTGEPDCNSTFAMLIQKLADVIIKNVKFVRFQEWSIFIREICDSFTLSAGSTSTT
jgi:hypothetical protein